MSKNEKVINELLELAKNTQNESVFQKKHQYKKFKAKTRTATIQDYFSITPLVKGLWRLEFYRECIYWCKKIIEDNRLCDIWQRFFAFTIILLSFNELKDYELALDYGKKCLALSSEQSEKDEAIRDSMKLAFDIMRNASLQLDRNQDAMKYAKESLKIDVLRFNEKEIEKYELLLSYHKLIQMKMTNGDFASAHKLIYKHLTLFSLNSTSTNYLKVSMEKEGYGNNSPPVVPFLNNLPFNENLRDEWPIEFLDLCHRKMLTFIKNVQLFYYIGKICWQRHEIHLYCDDLQNNIEWGHEALKIVEDILLHFRQFTLINNQSYKFIDNCLKNLNESKGHLCEILSVKDFFVDAICMTLLLADSDHPNRNYLYLQLAKKLFLYLDAESLIIEKRQDFIIYSGLEKNASFYILEAQRTNEKIDAEKVMPFIEFCLRSCNEKDIVGDSRGAVNFHGKSGLKVQLLTLKTSLTIVNHMKICSSSCS